MDKKEIKKLVSNEIQKMCTTLAIETKKFIKLEYGFLKNMQKMVLEHEKKIEFAPTEEDLMKLIEKETRVEMKPVPPSRLDRIERMLKWLIIKNQIDYFANVGIHATDEPRERCKKDIRSMVKQLPDISDIIKP